MRSMLQGLCICTCILASANTWAFYAADITYSAVDLFTYSITVRGYSDPLIEQPSIQLDLGDGTQIEVPRNGVLDLFFWPCGELRVSTYTTVHTYASAGTYLLGVPMTDRPPGVLNFPGPSTFPFCAQALLVIDFGLGPNNSAEFETGMIETERIGNVLHHDPGILEQDGDSLAFEFVTPLGQNCMPISSYAGFDLSGFPNTTVSIDPLTGAFAWDHPYVAGGYSIVLRINEWRNGQFIGYATRDMMLCVTPDYLTNIPDSISPVKLILFPNPGIDRLQVADFKGRGMIEVHDALGRGVLPTALFNSDRPIATSTWEPGAYFISISMSDGSRQVVRWVKQ